MALSYLGSLSVGSLSIGTSLTLPQLSAWLLDLQTRLGNITANLATLVDVRIPSLEALTLALEAALANLVGLLAGLIAANAKLAPSLTADIGALGLLISPLEALIADLEAALSAGGIHLWAYEGPTGSVGAELASATASGLPGGSGPTQPVHALILATSEPASWTALGVVLRTS